MPMVPAVKVTAKRLATASQRGRGVALGAPAARTWPVAAMVSSSCIERVDMDVDHALLRLVHSVEELERLPASGEEASPRELRAIRPNPSLTELARRRLNTFDFRYPGRDRIVKLLGSFTSLQTEIIDGDPLAQVVPDLHTGAAGMRLAQLHSQARAASQTKR